MEVYDPAAAILSAMRKGTRRALVAALALGALALVPVPASLASGSLSGIPTTGATGATTAVTGPPAATTATATSSTAAGGGGLGTTAELGIGVAALALFAGIILVIRDDIHVHLPRHATNTSIDRERGTVTPRAERVKRSRAKAKAARRARRAKR
jgi:hypothetical protein